MPPYRSQFRCAAIFNRAHDYYLIVAPPFNDQIICSLYISMIFKEFRFVHAEQLQCRPQSRDVMIEVQRSPESAGSDRHAIGQRQRKFDTFHDIGKQGVAFGCNNKIFTVHFSVSVFATVSIFQSPL